MKVESNANGSGDLHGATVRVHAYPLLPREGSVSDSESSRNTVSIPFYKASISLRGISLRLSDNATAAATASARLGWVSNFDQIELPHQQCGEIHTSTVD